jgi:hypothetical protein
VQVFLLVYDIDELVGLDDGAGRDAADIRVGQILVFAMSTRSIHSGKQKKVETPRQPPDQDSHRD